MTHRLHRHPAWASFRRHYLSFSSRSPSFLSSSSSAYSVAQQCICFVHRFEAPNSARPVLPHFMKPFLNPAEPQAPFPPPHEGLPVDLHSTVGDDGDDAKKEIPSLSRFASSNGKQRKQDDASDREKKKGEGEDAKQHRSVVPSSRWAPVLSPWPVDVLEFNTSMGSDGGHALRHFYGTHTVSQDTQRNPQKTSPSTPHGGKEKDGDGIRLPCSSSLSFLGGTPVSPPSPVDRSSLPWKEKARVEAAEVVYAAWCDWWCSTRSGHRPHTEGGDPSRSFTSHPPSTAHPHRRTDDGTFDGSEDGTWNHKRERDASRQRPLSYVSCEEVQEQKGWMCERCLRVHVGLSFATAVTEKVASTPSLFSLDISPEQEGGPNEAEGRTSTAVYFCLPPFASIGAAPLPSGSGGGGGGLLHAASPSSLEREERNASLPLLHAVAWKDIATRTVCPHCHTLRPDRVGRAYTHLLLPILSHAHDVATDQEATSLRHSWWICGACLEYNTHRQALPSPIPTAVGTTTAAPHPASTPLSRTASIAPLLPLQEEREGAPLLPNHSRIPSNECRCCAADGDSLCSGHFFPPFPPSSALPLGGRESPARDIVSALPFQRGTDYTDGDQKQGETVHESKASLLVQEGAFCGASSPLHPLPPSSSSSSSSSSFIHESADLIGKPVHSIVNTRNKIMKWSCGHCREVNSLQSTHCRYCHAERYGFVVACPRCAASSCLSNAMVYGEGEGGGHRRASLARTSDADPAAFPLTDGSDSSFGPHHCFSPFSAGIRCERCRNILHGGDVVRWVRRDTKENEKKKKLEVPSSAGSVSQCRSSSSLSSSSLSSFSFVPHHREGSGGKGWWCGCGFVNPPLVPSCLRCRLPRWLPPQQREAVVLSHWDREGCSHWWCEGCQTINRASAKVVVVKKQKEQGRMTEETNAGGGPEDEEREMASRTPTPTPTTSVTTTAPTGTAFPKISMVKTTRTLHGDLYCTCCGSPWHFEQLQEDIVSTTSSLKKGNRVDGGGISYGTSSSFGAANDDVESVRSIGTETQTTETGVKQESVDSDHCPVTCWWRCACHHVNRRFNLSCACCDLPPQTKGITADVLSFWSKGDWICTQCLRHNYKLKVVCLCGAKRLVASTS